MKENTQEAYTQHIGMQIFHLGFTKISPYQDFTLFLPRFDLGFTNILPHFNFACQDGEWGQGSREWGHH